jgi:2-dehydrotetronate isomerase
MPKFAVSLNMMFTEWPLLERFQAAADAGFSAVEVQFPYEATPEAIAAKLSANKQELLLINTPRGPAETGGRGLASLPEQTAAFRESFDLAMRYCDVAGAQKIHVTSGQGPSANAETFKSSLKWAAERVAGKPVQLLLEPLNLRDNPGYFMSDFNLAARIIKDLALPNVRLQYDIYHRQPLHGDVAVSLKEMMPITGHIQIAGVPERHEPIDCELDFPHLFGLIDRLGYAGWVGLEYKPRAGTVEGLGWMEG